MTTQTLNPNGNSDVQLTPSPLTYLNWQCVSSDHQTEPDEDATIVSQESITGTQRDLYTLDPNTIGPGDTINSVAVYHRSKKTGAHTGSSAGVIKTHGTEYKGGTFNLTTSYVTNSNTWTTNPFTGAPWTKAEIDALIAGVALYVSNILNTVSVCTWVYVVVSYTPAAPSWTSHGDGLTEY